MPSSDRPTRAAALGHAALLAAALGTGAAAEPPRPRVMSLNVCTDQLVLELAEPGQVVSLSHLSDDPLFSFHHASAAGVPKNAGLAEQVLSVRPDLVVTGTYSLHNTAPLLRSLGMGVEAFDYAQTLETIPDDIRRMGALVGAPERAERAAAAFEQELEAYAAERRGTEPTAIVFTQNGIVYGAGTLIDSVLRAAGFRNLAAEHGLAGMAPFPLERLIAEKPELTIFGRPDREAPALADRIMRHPALSDLPHVVTTDVVPDGAWACGGPFTLLAVRALRAERERMRSELRADAAAE